MPKDEFDFEDPLELNGVGVACGQDTTEAMCECLIEEFMRLGYNARQILALFRNPYYLGMNMVMQNRGEQFVRDAIAEVFARWGRPVSADTLRAMEPVSRPGQKEVESTEALENFESRRNFASPDGSMPPSTAGAMPEATDPMGEPIPSFNA